MVVATGSAGGVGGSGAPVPVLSTGRTMAPWDELEYLDFPLITYPSIAVGTSLLLSGNPQRINVYFNNGTNVGLMVVPGSGTVGFTAGLGFEVVNSLPPVVFRHRDDPGLPQMDWWINNPSAAPVQIMVMQVVLAEFPR